MKTLCALLVLGIATSTSQTVYQVPAGSHDNQIALTLANESSNTALEGVVVKPLKMVKDITVTSTNPSVKAIPAKGEAEVSLKFNVSREAKINAKDTLIFMVSDKSGATWSKSIVVSYAPPATFGLDQNFPNPFNPSTTVYYQLPSPGHVTIRVYDVLGREVRTLVDEVKDAGLFEVQFNARSIASGSYFCRMEAKGSSGQSFTQLRKMMVLK